MKKLYPEKNYPHTYDALDKIFNNTYNGIVILNLDGHWIKVNDSICDLLGYQRHELFNMNIENMIFREDLGVHANWYGKLIEGKVQRYQVEQRYFHKKGYIIWALISVSLISYNDGTPKYMIWQFTDITSRKKYQNRLKMLLDVAGEQNGRLTSFADIVTHNLRSHSGNLATLADFLEEEYGWLAENENFTTLKQAIENLEETVSHLTEVAKIKEVDEEEIEPLNLSGYVEKAIYNIAAIAKNSGTSIINEIEEDIYVKGIPAYLDSIILNFLTNAIKYRSKEREPLIKLMSSIENGFVVFNIIDNGLGIDLEMHGDKLFHMYKTFHRNDDAIGIGLFITKAHIESLGGKVEVKSTVNQGTEFSVYLKEAKV